MANVTIDQEGNPQVYLANYWRYHVRYSDEFDTPEAAHSFLQTGNDYGELYPESIANPEGEVIWDREHGWLAGAPAHLLAAQRELE